VKTREKYKGLAPKYISTLCANVKSFFNYHRSPLMLRVCETNVMFGRKKPRYLRYNITLEDITKMNKVANARDRYILLVGKSIGLRSIDFINLTIGQFITNMKEKEPPYSLGEVFTEKRGIIAKPFLDHEAKEAVEVYLNELKATKNFDINKPILSIQKGELNKTLQKLAKKAGIETGNTFLNFHCLRIFLITRLARVMEENRWKQIVGKMVPESAYVMPFALREDYAKVMQYTCEKAPAEILELEQLREKSERQDRSLIEQDKKLALQQQKLRETTEKLNEVISKYNKFVEQYREEKEYFDPSLESTTADMIIGVLLVQHADPKGLVSKDKIMKEATIKGVGTYEDWLEWERQMAEADNEKLTEEQFRQRYNEEYEDTRRCVEYALNKLIWRRKVEIIRYKKEDFVRVLPSKRFVKKPLKL